MKRPAGSESERHSKANRWHTFRHTFGTLLKANGKDVRTVQELLRYANRRITLELYTQATTSKKRAAQSRIVRMMVPNLGEMRDATHLQKAR
jgi:site-specific recombinase XerD